MRPMMSHLHDRGPRHFWSEGLFRPHLGMLDEIKDKEEAIELLELQYEKVKNRQKELMKRLKELELAEKRFTEAIKEVGSLKEFSNEDLKKILRKNYYGFMKAILKEE